MSLEDLINNDPTVKEKDDVNIEGGRLDHFFGVESHHEKLRDPKLCPNCGSNNTEQHPDVDYERVCNDCNILTYIPTEYNVPTKIL